MFVLKENIWKSQCRIIPSFLSLSVGWQMILLPYKAYPFISGSEVWSVVYSILSWDVVDSSMYALPALLTTVKEKQVLWSHRLLIHLV